MCDTKSKNREINTSTALKAKQKQTNERAGKQTNERMNEQPTATTDDKAAEKEKNARRVKQRVDEKQKRNEKKIGMPHYYYYDY